MPKKSRTTSPLATSAAKARQKSAAKAVEPVDPAPPVPAPPQESVIQRTRTSFNFRSWLPANVFDAPVGKPVKLGVQMQNQCHSNWCWAAVAESIARFYNEKTNCTQCVIAKTRLNRKDCCDAPCGSDDELQYNIPSTLESTLQIFGANGDIDVENRPAPIEKIRQEIQDGRPVCVRVVWTTGQARGGGHFVVLAGYVPGTERLLVLDPLGPEVRDTTHKTLGFSYPPHGGEWKGTYYTVRSTKPCPDK